MKITTFGSSRLLTIVSQYLELEYTMNLMPGLTPSSGEVLMNEFLNLLSNLQYEKAIEVGVQLELNHSTYLSSSQCSPAQVLCFFQFYLLTVLLMKDSEHARFLYKRCSGRYSCLESNEEWKVYRALLLALLENNHASALISLSSLVSSTPASSALLMQLILRVREKVLSRAVQCIAAVYLTISVVDIATYLSISTTEAAECTYTLASYSLFIAMCSVHHAVCTV